MKHKAHNQTSKPASFALDTHEPYDTFVAQVLSKIDNQLPGSSSNFNQYTITYSIHGIVKNACLDSKAAYKQLIQFVIPATKKTPKTVKVVVEEKPQVEQQAPSHPHALS